MADLRADLIENNIRLQWSNVGYDELDKAYALLTNAEKNAIVASLINADNGAKNLMTDKFNAQFLINATALADANAPQISALQTTFNG